MSDVILVHTGPPGPAGPTGADGPLGTITVTDNVTTVESVELITLGDNLTLSDLDDGNVRIDASGTGGGGGASAGTWGSDYDLTFDGTTSQSEELNSLLDGAVPGTVFRLISPSGDPLHLDAFTGPNSDGVTLDLSQIDVNMGKYGSIGAKGELTELPESNLFRLREDAEPGDSILQIDITPQGNMTILAIGTHGILRGKNDGAGNALQRHEFRITARDTAPGAETITIDPPLPEDEGTFEVEYVAGDYEEATGSVDRSLLSVKVGQLLDADVDPGQDFAAVPTPADFAAGDMVELYDDYEAEDIGGSSSNSIRREFLLVRAVDADNVYFQQSAERDYTTARNAMLFKVTPLKDVTIIAARSIRLNDAPDAAPSPRQHYYFMDLCLRPTLIGVKVDEDLPEFGHRGQAGRAYRCIGARILNSRRIGAKNTGSGDGYGFAAYYCRDTVFDGSYTERNRHGIVDQGSTNTVVRNFRGVNNLINTVDAHGLWSVGLTVHDGKIDLGRTFAADATTKSGIVLGNTSHYGGDHRVTIRDVEITGPPDIAETRGITIRAGCTKVELTRGVRVSNVEIGCDVQRISNKPDLEATDIDLGGLIAEDCVEEGIRLAGNAPAWEATTVYTATGARPAYVESNGSVYRTLTGGTSGGSAPVHPSGSASDGGVTWVWVSDDFYYPLKRIKLDGSKLRRCGQQVRARRVEELAIYDVRVTEPATPIIVSTGQLNPAFNLIECPEVVVRNSDGFETAGGVALLDCPEAFLDEVAFYDMEAGEAWLIDLGGNDGTRVGRYRTRGTTAGIDFGGGSSINVTPIVPDPAAASVDDVLTVVNPTTGEVAWAAQTGGGGGGGDITNAQNLPTGVGIWKDKTGATLRFRSLSSATEAVTIAAVGDEVSIDVDLASDTVDGLMSSEDKAKLDGVGPAGVLSFNDRTGTVSPASGDYTAAQITETGLTPGTGLKIMTGPERTKLTALDTALQLPAGGTTGYYLRKTASASAWEEITGGGTTFPLITTPANGRIVIAPTGWDDSTVVGNITAFLNAAVTFYSPQEAVGGTVALQLVARNSGGDFIRTINNARRRSAALETDNNDKTFFAIWNGADTLQTDQRFWAGEAGVKIGENIQTYDLASGERLYVNGNARFTGNINGPTAGNIYSSPLRIGQARIWFDDNPAVMKLRARSDGDPINRGNGEVLW